MLESQIMICDEHALPIWAHVQRYKRDSDVIEAAAKLHAQRLETEAWADTQVQGRSNPGPRNMAAYWAAHADPSPDEVTEYEDIYYLRQSELIKIGYSADLMNRLRAYGPAAVILAHHPGDRAVERDLHRTFRPFLARGREWYHPRQLLLDHIDRVVTEHGEPWCVPAWPAPREPAHAMRRSAQAKPTGLSL